MYDLPHELPNNVSRILGNEERKRKFQNWVETQASAQSPLQKSLLGNSSQNMQKQMLKSPGHAQPRPIPPAPAKYRSGQGAQRS